MKKLIVGEVSYKSDGVATITKQHDLLDDEFALETCCSIAREEFDGKKIRLIAEVIK